MKDVELKMPNGMTVVVWQDSDGVWLGVANEKGLVVVDRKLTFSEYDKLNSVSYRP